MNTIEIALDFMRQQPGREPEAWAKLLKMRLEGKLTHADIQQVTKERFKDDYDVLLDRFGRGNLFKAQRLTFDSWLNIAPDEYKRDMFVYSEYQAFCDLMGHGPFPEIKMFWVLRIASPSLETRKELGNSKERQQFLDVWAQQNSENGWNQWS